MPDLTDRDLDKLRRHAIRKKQLAVSAVVTVGADVLIALVEEASSKRKRRDYSNMRKSAN